MPTLQEKYLNNKSECPGYVETVELYLTLDRKDRERFLVGSIAGLLVTEKSMPQEDYFKYLCTEIIRRSSMKLAHCKCSVCDGDMTVPERYKDLVHVCFYCLRGKA